jgi:hypothetical protein
VEISAGIGYLALTEVCGLRRVGWIDEGSPALPAKAG